MKNLITQEAMTAFAKTFAINVGVCILYLIVGYITVKIFNFFIDKIFSKVCNAKDSYEFRKQAATVKNLVKSIINGLIMALTVLSLLGKFNIDIRPLLTAAGVVGVAVGFASRRFVEDIIMGVFILLEGQLRVGDEVTIDSFNGTVEKVSLKMTILRNTSGHVHYIRNGMINAITNKTRGFASPVINIGVAYNSDLDKVMRVMETVANDMRKDEKFGSYILDDAQVQGVTAFQDSAINIRIKIKTKATHQWTVEREYNRLLKLAFDKEGIEMPFPQRDVHIIKEN